jgi:hypothetical protein
MKDDTKLTEILKTFSKQEMRSFGKFVKSPFFKTGRDVNALYNYLQKNHPDFKKEFLSKEKIFKEIYPCKEFNKKRIINDMFELTKMAEEFLVQLAVHKNIQDKSRYLMGELKERKLHPQLLKKIKEFEKSTDNKIELSERSFLNGWFINMMKAEYYFEERNYDKLLYYRIKYSDNLFMLFFKDYLSLKRDLMIFRNVYNTASDDDIVNKALEESLLIENLVNALDKSGFKYNQLLITQYLAFKTVNEPDNEIYYYKLKDLILKHFEEFNHTEKYKLLGDLETYCTYRNNEKFNREQFEMLKFRFEKGLYAYSQHDYISPATFRNTIYVSISLNELDWLEEFIGKYTDKLNPVNRTSLKLLAEANICFARKKFGKALEKLVKIKYDFFLFKVDIKNLMLKIYYELDLTEQAYSLIDTFKHYLAKTDDIPSVFKEYHIGFLNSYTELLNRKTKSNITNLDQAIKKIESHENVISKNWLIEKLNEISK